MRFWNLLFYLTFAHFKRAVVQSHFFRTHFFKEQQKVQLHICTFLKSKKCAIAHSHIFKERKNVWSHIPTFSKCKNVRCANVQMCNWPTLRMITILKILGWKEIFTFEGLIDVCSLLMKMIICIPKFCKNARICWKKRKWNFHKICENRKTQIVVQTVLLSSNIGNQNNNNYNKRDSVY